MSYSPVFEKNGNRLIILHPDFVGETQEDAQKIRLGSMLVECIILGLNTTDDVVDLTQDIQHFEGFLGDTRVAVLSGAIFDEAMSIYGQH